MPVTVTVLPALFLTWVLKLPVSRPPYTLKLSTVTVPVLVALVVNVPVLVGTVNETEATGNEPAVLALNERIIARCFCPFLAVIVVTGVVVVLKETVSRLVVDNMRVLSRLNETLPDLVTVVLPVDMVCPAIFSHEVNNTARPANSNSVHRPDLRVKCLFIIWRRNLSQQLRYKRKMVAVIIN